MSDLIIAHRLQLPALVILLDPLEFVLIERRLRIVLTPQRCIELGMGCLVRETHGALDLPMELRMGQQDARRDTAMPPITYPLNGARLMREAEHFSDLLRTA